MTNNGPATGTPRRGSNSATSRVARVGPLVTRPDSNVNTASGRPGRRTRDSPPTLFSGGAGASRRTSGRRGARPPGSEGPAPRSPTVHSRWSRTRPATVRSNATSARRHGSASARRRSGAKCRSDFCHIGMPFWRNGRCGNGSTAKPSARSWSRRRSSQTARNASNSGPVTSSGRPRPADRTNPSPATVAASSAAARSRRSCGMWFPHRSATPPHFRHGLPRQNKIVDASGAPEPADGPGQAAPAGPMSGSR